MDVCCSSCASVASICDTCDSVELICDWFGAGPGSVVDVVAPAPDATTGAIQAPRSPAIMAARATRVFPRAVFRQSTAPTCESVTAPRLEFRHPAVAARLHPCVCVDFTFGHD